LVVGQDATFRRRQEVVAGRQAAHSALAALGLQAESIGQGPSGQPLFPETTCGSISHSQDVAVAVVAMRGRYLAVGVDIDDARPLGEAAAKDVTWEAEVARVCPVLDLSTRDAIHSFVFSAKEAVFKCQFPLTGREDLTALQARLLPLPTQPGALRVTGWRVPAPVAAALTQIIVTRQVVGSTVLAVAVAV
jgi:4'-phosphopantetheinyl transferase EntD